MGHNNLVPNNVHGNVIYGGGGGGGGPGGGTGGGYIGGVTFKRDERSPLLQKDTIITIDYVGVGPVVPLVGFSFLLLFSLFSFS